MSAVAEGVEFATEDLSQIASQLNSSSPSPFDGDPVYQRFFDALFRALHRHSPRHVALVREPGVGEQALLVELARATLGSSPPFLAGKRILLLNMWRLQLHGALAAVHELLASAEADVIMCLEGWRSAGPQAGAEGLRTVLSHAAARTRCRMIGLLSPRECDELIASDPDLREYFTILAVPEPQGQLAYRLVSHFARGMEISYGLIIDDAAVDRAVTLCDHYILNDRLPHKAVKILRAACDDRQYERTQLGIAGDRITGADVLRQVSNVTGVPQSTLSGVGDRIDYERNFKDLIVGQEHAVDEVVTELGLIKAGMTDAGKPASVMMFIGQTGTGKTEMAKALARFYSSSRRLKTFTLGNFSEPHSVSGIIGVPPGYVGHDQGGRLVNELNADPYGVFLLDEADKAHPDVMQPFLNLFDEGWICDQKGNKAFAHRAIFILTTNVGQRQIADMCRSGKTIEEITLAIKDTLARIRHTKSNRPVFSAEFLARLKRVIVFRSLDQEAMGGIARLLLKGLCEEWATARRKLLSLPAELVEAIARRAYELDEKSQGKEGGRIVRKIIADVLEAPIQRAISRDPGAYQNATEVVVEFFDNTAGRLSAQIVRVRFVERTDDSAPPSNASCEDDPFIGTPSSPEALTA